jgi:hypothetical protein
MEAFKNRAAKIPAPARSGISRPSGAWNWFCLGSTKIPHLTKFHPAVGKGGENHPGRTRFETAELKADRIVAEELARLKWTQSDLAAHQKSHPTKQALAARLRREKTLTVKQISRRLHLGSPKGAGTNLHKFMKNFPAGSVNTQLKLK